MILLSCGLWSYLSNYKYTYIHIATALSFRWKIVITNIILFSGICGWTLLLGSAVLCTVCLVLIFLIWLIIIRYILAGFFPFSILIITNHFHLFLYIRNVGMNGMGGILLIVVFRFSDSLSLSMYLCISYLGMYVYVCPASYVVVSSWRLIQVQGSSFSLRHTYFWKKKDAEKSSLVLREGILCYAGWSIESCALSLVLVSFSCRVNVELVHAFLV